MDQATVRKMAKLSRLHLTDEEIPYFQNALNRILVLEDKLKEVDTTGVEPMYHSIETTLYLREDEVTESNERELMQSIAPQIMAGLYLVPKVIE